MKYPLIVMLFIASCSSTPKENCFAAVGEESSWVGGSDGNYSGVLTKDYEAYVDDNGNRYIPETPGLDNAKYAREKNPVTKDSSIYKRYSVKRIGEKWSLCENGTMKYQANKNVQ